jgi:type IV pilus assembly protein PilZ
MTSPDNRQQPRAPIELKVEYTKMNTFFADYTKNISKGGTFIKTPTAMPTGTQFKFELAIPGFTGPVSLNGEVTWVLDPVSAGEANAEPGMGIRFLFADVAEQQAFETAVEKLMVESLGEDISRQLLGKSA